LCDRKDVPDLIKQLTKAGKLGMKTGEGLQNYAPERKAALQAARARRLIAVRRALEERE
jgi:3-hydroxybutyryl-CoA dehydrogenase/5-formyl-3-hydroxy-2-methylpyridine 4-carboxylate dehydrogenase